MTLIKLTSWNVNSVRLRSPQIARFTQEQQPDIIGLQEIKCLKEQFPYDEFKAMGFEHIEVCGQKGMHGAATVSKFPLKRMDTNFCPEGHARHVSTIVDMGGKNDFEFHNFYIPAGGDEPDVKANPKFAHKLEFIGLMIDYFVQRAPENARKVLVGDFNIAPHENDVWSHKQLLKVVSHTPVEVDILNKLLASGNFTDCARIFTPDDVKLYSWWSYRSRDINKSDRGRRLDHIWLSPALKDAAEKTLAAGHEIHRPCRLWERPSDHAPVTQVLDFS